MSATEISIPTPDGPARAFASIPGGQGPWPAVICFMDALGIRPALFAMCKRLASHGYFVLLPDIFWRGGPYDPVNVAVALRDEASRRETFGRFTATSDPERAMRDTRAFLHFLAGQPQVKGRGVGVIGYCMGGGLALRAAGNFPERVVVAAAFHGSRLATDASDSPHLLAPAMKAKVLVAGADEDAGFPPEQAERLKAVLDAAGLDNEVTIYPGARHGYAVPDTPAYNRDASERHWRELLSLLDGVLKAR
jgi:carboxymethylenebutenolidase